ncbi:LytR/AlgR family response regulator transcription factor [Pontimicrobium sp. IMCC45349]|uniref:LytR/AlgR family response regulator transcription factor n=1 Tax=Pontimicrobium sp. IMCC45349 TaxID=3391574 RepID=UPI0039A392E1
MTNKKHISCLIVDDEAIAREVIATHLSKLNNITIVASCSNAIEAFQYINTHDINLVFLDINMPEISGISFAKSINSNIKVIFTTAYRDYAVEGFELRAVDYLLKPISFDRLLKAINTYFHVHQSSNVTTIENTNNNNFIFVRSERVMVKIRFSDIIYIESYSDYLKIHLRHKTIVTRETISAIEAKLPKDRFVRIHRSYITAISHIESYTNDYVNILNKALTISRSYKKDALNTLEQFK